MSPATHPTAPSDQTAIDQTAIDQTAIDQTASDQTAIDQAAIDQAGSDQTASDRAGTNQADRGLTVWLTGLPSAGKSTLAHAAAARLAGEGVRVQVLDGDEVRPYLSAGLGFSQADRNTNVSRIGWVARLLSSHGVVTLVPVIAPYASARAAVRADHEEHGVGYAEVYVSTPVEVTASRDVKGLYAQQAAGAIRGLTGVDDPYEVPQDPEVEIDTTSVALTVGVDRIAALVRAAVGAVVAA